MSGIVQSAQAVHANAESFQDVDFRYTPVELINAVKTCLLAVDIVISKYPHFQILRHEEHSATQIDTLRTNVPADTTVHVLFLAKSIKPAKFALNIDSSVADMYLHHNMCNYASMFCQDILQKLLGDAKWLVCRIWIVPRCRHVLLQSRSESPQFNNVATNPLHTVLGIFAKSDESFEETPKSGVNPKYILDPTILQYKESRSMRFSAWDDYRGFATASEKLDSRLWKMIQPGQLDDNFLHGEYNEHKFWSQASALVADLLRGVTGCVSEYDLDTMGKELRQSSELDAIASEQAEVDLILGLSESELD